MHPVYKLLAGNSSFQMNAFIATVVDRKTYNEQVSRKYYDYLTRPLLVFAQTNMQTFMRSQETKKSMSQNESLVRAMVENAKASSPTENLENAAMAQKNFMLVQVDKSIAEGKQDQDFLLRIAKRSNDIRNNDKDE